MTMIKFNLNRQYKLAQEGERVFEITECVATPSGYPTEMKWTLKDVEDGATIMDKCNFTTTVWKLSNIASVALDVKDGDEMDAVQLASALVGKKIKCEVVHNPGTRPKDDGTFPMFANIKRVICRVDDNNSTPNPFVETPVEDENPRASILNGL